MLGFAQNTAAMLGFAQNTAAMLGFVQKPANLPRFLQKPANLPRFLQNPANRNARQNGAEIFTETPEIRAKTDDPQKPKPHK